MGARARRGQGKKGQREFPAPCIRAARNLGLETLRNIAGWMEVDARLFVHISSHPELMYPLQTEGNENWTGRHFCFG